MSIDKIRLLIAKVSSEWDDSPFVSTSWPFLLTWGDLRALLDDRDRLAAALEQREGWISVRERLPDKDGPCVVLYGDNDRVTGSGVGIPFVVSNPEYAAIYAGKGDYTHWMPLLSIPLVGEEEKEAA